MFKINIVLHASSALIFGLLGITTVLTMTFMGLEARKDLPKVTYPTALDYFVFISFMYIFSTVVQVQPYRENLLGTNPGPYLVRVGAPLHQAGVRGVLRGGAGGGGLP